MTELDRAEFHLFVLVDAVDAQEMAEVLVASTVFVAMDRIEGLVSEPLGWWPGQSVGR